MVVIITAAAQRGVISTAVRREACYVYAHSVMHALCVRVIGY